MESIFPLHSLDSFLKNYPIERVYQERSQEYYDLLSFGGGSCPRVIGKNASRFGWNNICFITNGSDNGGSTYKIVEALRPEYGPTLPVGDITSALISLLDTPRYEILNLRSWKLDPVDFDEKELHSFSKEIRDQETFSSRLRVTIKWYQEKFSDVSSSSHPDSHEFYPNLLKLGQWVDEVGLIRSGIKGLDLSEASVRHHIFNAVMVRMGAYDSGRKVADTNRFMIGLWLLKKVLGISYSVFPCSIDEQVLFAEWFDENGKVVWSTKHQSLERPVLGVGGQVALSNSPDFAKTLGDGKYAKFGHFGFKPELTFPRAYPEALEAIRRVIPGRPILFGPSSFVASTSPCICIKPILEELAKRSDCPKILFLNLTLNNETLGMSVTDFLNFWELITGKRISETLDYVVVNNDSGSTAEIADALADRGDSLETFKFRGPLLLADEERISLPSRGIILIEAPLASVKRQLMRLNSTGERENVCVPNHKSECLMTIAKHSVDTFASYRDRKKSHNTATYRKKEINLKIGKGETLDCVIHSFK